MSDFSESDLQMIERWKASPMMSNASFRKDLQRIIHQGLPLLTTVPNGTSRVKISPRMKPEIGAPVVNAQLLERMEAGARLRQFKIRETRSSTFPSSNNLQHVPAPLDCPSFTHCLTTSNLIKGRLPIPTCFWEKYLKKRYKLFSKVQLKVVGRTSNWSVGLKDEGTRHLIQSGVKSFSKDMSLSAGSVCKFDLQFDSDTITFYVSVVA